MTLAFDSLDYHADDRFRPAHYVFEGNVASGWQVLRDGRVTLMLGAGYQPLAVTACGVCSTDLARRFLPFPLPQIIGHELVARDEDGRRVLVEINASHAARGIQGACPFCDRGCSHHCPERLVLGIHDLPGGFGPHVLAPTHNVLPVPEMLSTETATLMEPFAAALNAVDRLDLEHLDSVAVLGPRRLGMLVLAALRARREARSLRFDILAIARRPHLHDLALTLGADRALLADDTLPSELADVVVDTTGSPEGFELALRLARREVHLKSTHGRAAAGLRHLTELVVDELCLVPDDGSPLGDDALEFTGDVDPARARAAQDALQQRSPSSLPRHETVIVDRAAAVDLAIRPRPDRESSLVAPGGSIRWRPGGPAPRTPIERAVLERGLRITSSRCGEFKRALALIESDSELRRLGDQLITHRFPATALAEAFEAARRPDCLKALIVHD